MYKYFLFFILINFAIDSNAQNISTLTEKQIAVKNKQILQKNSWFKKYPIQNVGPSVMGGRVVDIEVNPTNTNEFYVAYASNGVYKTTNNGQNFVPIFDNQSRITVGDIALSTSNPSIIWVGTGENNSSRSSYAGMGVYKSENAGKTWEFCGLENTQHIGRIITHPNNEKIAFVASIGALYSKNEERGVYKTIDGGKTWKKTLFINDSTGVIDMAIHPKNPNLIWACAWERSRKSNQFKESGQGSGLYFSENGGENWTKVQNELPQGSYVGRMGIA
ncbi:MAG: glycosyl hydrolase, partial [Cytophagales bacterium]